ncbi:hypothetical protein CYMTET_15751 [Cymbomonas tetramitiformis]|uniref:Uncharacterized protein n=1 Tax=Cymbomonas tetramitiformis TaxID=36881 RepID=A0AAE0GDT7_9CHLO|nr:hypothetical protein CYMTET_15751 [Cymbomonas tetramitiformis]
MRANSHLAFLLLGAWREETRRVKEIKLEITKCNDALSMFYAEKCAKAWRAIVDFASKCTRFAVQRKQHVRRKALHEWAALTDIPDVTPNQWATLRKHLRRLSGKENAIAAITWEARSPQDERTLRRTATLEVYVPQQGVRSVPDRNPYEVLSSEDDPTTDAEDNGPIYAPPPSRSKAPTTPRPTQRERGVRMQALMDVAH